MTKDPEKNGNTCIQLCNKMAKQSLGVDLGRATYLRKEINCSREIWRQDLFITHQ